MGSECLNIRSSGSYNKGYTFGSNLGCNTNYCSVKTVTFTAGVALSSNDALSIATCSRGYNTTPTNNQCILKQTDWATTVAEFSSTSGKV